MRRVWSLFTFVSLTIVLFLLFGTTKLSAQITPNEAPFLGAQIFLEPGQTPEQIDNWFRILKESEMSVCRIRMFESYMKGEDGNWDYTLFDYAFKSAEKYDIKILATLFPYTEKTDIGGFKFPHNEAHLESIATFIDNAVTHFKQYNCLIGWVLINEPGQTSVPLNSFSEERFEEWSKANPVIDYTKDGYPVLMDLRKQRFQMDYNTWYLQWLANEIRKVDPEAHLHVNSHAIFENAPQYDFPSWQEFLSSLGGSAHPSWHFGYFSRKQYALAMNANSEIIRSGAGDLPWIMTEIQGGNNTYSGTAPFCPTVDEITQWLWITMGAESKGAIFWSLNARASGIEAGEWAMLTFQDKPSERLTAAKNVAQLVRKHETLFANAKEFNSGINVLYAREAMCAEQAMERPSMQNYTGRQRGAVMKSVLGYYKAISEMGLNCALKEMSEFNFQKEDYSGEVIVLSHQLALPSKYVSALENFVAKGGTLLVDGLTAFFDENLHCTAISSFPFKTLFGGEIREYKLIDNVFNVELANNQIPAHLWRGTIVSNKSAKIISESQKEVFGIQNQYGEGTVVWVPSLMGLGSWMTGDSDALSSWLTNYLPLEKQPVYFRHQMDDVLMKTMSRGNKLITILINKSGEEKDIPLVIKNEKLSPKLIFSNYREKLQNENSINMKAEETLVIVWE